MYTSIRLSLENFKSWDNLSAFNMDGYIELLGENLIDDGSNGSGKTSLLQALYFVVYFCKNNRLPDGEVRIKDYIKEGSRQFDIRVDLALDGNSYSVKLSYTSQGETYFEQDDVKAINYLAGLTYSFFLPVFSNFASKDPRQRKAAILSDFDCESMVAKYCKNIDMIKAETTRLLNDIKEELDNIKSERSSLETTYKTSSRTYDLPASDLSVPIFGQIEEGDLQFLYDRLKTCVMDGNDAMQRKLSELLRKKQDVIEKAQDLYNRTSASKVSNFIKSKVKEYNAALDKEYTESVNAAEDAKGKDKADLEEKIDIIMQEISTKGKEKLSAQQIDDIHKAFDTLMSNCDELSINDIIAKLDELVESVKNNLAEEKYKLKSLLFELEEKLKKLKKSSTKKPTHIEIASYTPKSKPKTDRSLSKYYIVYDFSNGDKRLVEKAVSDIIPHAELDAFFDSIAEYTNPPQLTGIDDDTKKIQEELLQRDIKPVNDHKEQLWDKISTLVGKLYYEMTDKMQVAANDIISLETKVTQLESLSKDIKINFPNYLCSVVIRHLRDIADEYKKQFFNPLTSLSFYFEDRRPFAVLDGRAYLLLSEGEKSKINLIFNLSYRDLLNFQQQVESDRLLCDEIFDGMDDLSRAQAISLLSSKAIANNVLIVSHTERGLSGFHSVKVQKDKIGSKLISANKV